MQPSADRDAIWERLRGRLDDGEASQADVARALGVRDSTVNTWYRGRAVPDSVMIARLCAVYGINGHWVLTGQGNPDVMVQGAVEQADVVGSMAYQAGGRAAMALMAEEVDKALASARKAWGAAPAPSPDQLESVRGAASKVAAHLRQESRKKGRAAG